MANVDECCVQDLEEARIQHAALLAMNLKEEEAAGQLAKSNTDIPHEARAKAKK